MGPMLFVILQNSEHKEEAMTDPYDYWSAFTFTFPTPENENLLISCNMSMYLGLPLVYFDVIVGGCRTCMLRYAKVLTFLSEKKKCQCASP